MSETRQADAAQEAAPDECDHTRQLEAKLREVEERQILLANQIHDFAILSLGTDGRITWWGDGAQKLLGYEAEEIVGRPGSVLFTPEDRDAGLPHAVVAADGVHGDVLHVLFALRPHLGDSQSAPPRTYRRRSVQSCACSCLSSRGRP